MEQNKSNIDNELMLQIVGYNAEAFQQLFNRYSPSILALIREVISNPKLAESVLFNVYSVFLKRLDYFNTTSSNVFTYLTLLTRNISIDVLKRMKFVEDIPIYSDEYEIEFILPNLSKEITTIDLEQRYIFGEHIKNYRTQLTEVQNLLLSLIYFEGLNEEEIAKRLNVPMVTVRQKVLNIMETLHQQYAGQNSVNQNNKAILELIKLEALGFLTSEERMMLENLKENDPDFMWKELGEYQNLTALISASIPEQVMPRNYNEDVMNIFTQILLQDGDVIYPIVASEIPIPEAEVNPEKAKPIQEIQVKNEEPVKVEQKENGFQLKFREPDPTELNILKKLETIDNKQKTNPALSKSEPAKQVREIKPSVNKPDVVINRTITTQLPKEIVSAAVKEEKPVQAKINIPEDKTIDHQIINDDPLIVIEEPKPVVAKVEEKHVSRLTPTSSINIEDIIKKDINPIKRNTLVENSRLANPVQAKQPIQELPKQDVLPNPLEVIKEEIKSKPAVEEKKDITFKVNQTPKEIKPTLPEIEKTAIVNEQKEVPVQPEKFEIKFKTNETPKEIRPSSTVQPKKEIPVQQKQEVPQAKQSDIKFRSIETPKEIKKTIAANEPAVKPVEIKSASPITQPKPVEQPKENVKPVVLPIAEVKTVENKIIVPTQAPEKISPKSEDAQKLSSLFKTRERKVAETSNEEKQAINKSTLKIRETKFVEEDKKTIVTSKPDPQIDEIKSVVENILKDKHLTGTLTVDEVLAKLNQEKPKSEPILEPEIVVDANDHFEEELNNIHKKRKVGILVSAALFVVVAATAVFIYMKFQPDAVIAANDVKPNKPQTVATQQVVQATDNTQDLALNETTTLPEENLDKNKIEEVKEELKVEEKTTNNQLKISPLTNNSNKQDESYTSINTNNQNKENNQTAAAKTETTTPPKENKTTEQEPSVFVAVEEMPELIGGIKGLQNKIVYPKIAENTGTQGKVLVQAIVDENGNVISAKTIKGIGAGCDEVATDAVLNSKFKPGKQRGKNVKVQVTIPIVFKK